DRKKFIYIFIRVKFKHTLRFFAGLDRIVAPTGCRHVRPGGLQAVGVMRRLTAGVCRLLIF
ncbi:hypothetical protein, partial [Paramuribaculum intestinale]|uniref:hypothetical protein n=1 Tax=Paramuribaculum intestinale TaxID=2094151 RepID=UPI0026E0579C